MPVNSAGLYYSGLPYPPTPPPPPTPAGIDQATGSSYSRAVTLQGQGTASPPPGEQRTLSRNRGGGAPATWYRTVVSHCGLTHWHSLTRCHTGISKNLGSGEIPHGSIREIDTGSVPFKHSGAKQHGTNHLAQSASTLTNWAMTWSGIEPGTPSMAPTT